MLNAHEITARVNVPEIITKQLKIGIHDNEKRRICLSSNWLGVYGFNPGDRHNVTPLSGASGLEVTFDAQGTNKVCERKYKTRRNNPFETLIDIQGQGVINAGIPSYTERVHFEMRKNRILITPLMNEVFAIAKRLRQSIDPYSAFVAMTGGIDVRCLLDCGFKIDAVLEHRPQEKRDRTNLTETGMLNVLANAAPRLAISEDITKIHWGKIERLMDDAPPTAVLHLSLQCDDFTNIKSTSLKERSLADLSTSRDLVYDGLRLIETVRPAVVLLEQVPGFATSSEGHLFNIKLRRWGYHVSDAVMSAPYFDGLTTRKRYYVVASIFPGFDMPAPKEASNESIWPLIEAELDNCREVSHCNAVKNGIKTGRIRIINEDSVRSPTFTKSQSRQAKDSVYIECDGRYFFPTNKLMQQLSGIPADMSFNCVSKTIESEIMGQSVDYPMHHLLAAQVHQHITDNVGKTSLVTIKRQLELAV